MAEMERHFKASRKPLFTYIQTMSAHWPYDYAYSPTSTCPAAGPAPTRRCTSICAACRWRRWTSTTWPPSCARRFPQERFLIVHYGDHHPMATRTLLGFDSDTEAEDVTLDPDSIGFVTYYAARGINYRVPALPQFETLDVAYLGTAMLELAGLPLSDSHASASG